MSTTRIAAAVLLASLAGLAAAHADPCGARPTAIPATSAHALRMVAEPPIPIAADSMRPSSGMVPDAGSTFPAVSEDGKTIVLLLEEAQDFTADPITTLVLVSSTGKRGAVFMAGGHTPVETAPAVVAKANEALAKSTWVSLPAAEACTTRPDAAGAVRSRVAFADGHAFAYDSATRKLTTTTRVGGTSTTRAQVIDLGAIGWNSLDDQDRPRGPGRACGRATGFTRAIWSSASRTLFLIPTGDLGGDSCVGLTGLVVPVSI